MQTGLLWAAPSDSPHSKCIAYPAVPRCPPGCLLCWRSGGHSETDILEVPATSVVTITSIVVKMRIHLCCWVQLYGHDNHRGFRPAYFGGECRQRC